jgi:hypothetical protein
MGDIPSWHIVGDWFDTILVGRVAAGGALK